MGRLRQIVINLVGNAIKFTEQGEVVLSVNLESLDENRVNLRFQVRDTGIGISKDKQDLIFESFSQADASTTRNYGGTGLGLAISKQLVTLMNGSIWLESELGKGSTFHFSAVFELADSEPAAPAGARSPLSQLPVLIVDDNATNRKVLAEVLSNWRLKVTLASSGSEALTVMASASEAGTPFQLILLDAQMPGMSGIDLARHLRGDPKLSATKILMLSSAGRPVGQIELQELNIVRFLSKPVKQSDLFDAMCFAIRINAPSKSVLTPAEPSIALRSLDLLLAEDSVVNQKVAVGLLKKRGHRVTIANNGKEAVDALKQKPFDLVLMDVQMPEMDALQATKAIREMEKSTKTHTLIVAMTANAMKGDNEKCINAGMDAYLSKPIRAAELYKAIENVVGNRGKSGPELS